MNLPMKQKKKHIDWWLPKGWGWKRDEPGAWDQQMQTGIYRTGRQQGPAVQHREIYSISCEKIIMEKKKTVAYFLKFGRGNTKRHYQMQ